MPLDTRVVGEATEAITHEVDARWIMAYAAGLGDFNSLLSGYHRGAACGAPGVSRLPRVARRSRQPETARV